MFQSARLKLTAFFALAVMVISISFSAVLYQGICLEINRYVGNLSRRQFIQRPGMDPQQVQQVDQALSQDKQDLKDLAKNRLIQFNAFIFLLAVGSGYFLAGQALKPIQESVEEQNRFIADASHELRTPLTALKASLEVNLRDKNLKLKDAKQVLADSLEEVSSLERLADNLLSLTQYSRGNRKLQMELVDLDEILTKSVNKVKALAKKKQIKLHVDLKQAQIMGDMQTLIDCFVIFFDNAIKYTKPNGNIWLSTKINKKTVEVKIKDDGIGIKQKELPHIFKRFYRVDPSRGDVKGFGLGLSLAKEMINLHKGSVSAASVWKKGSTFTIKFPIEK